MNTVKGVVTKVLDEPYKEYGHWFRPVEYNSYGRISETDLMFNTKQQAQSVEKGYEFKT